MLLCLKHSEEEEGSLVGSRGEEQMTLHSNTSRDGDFYLLADNWERKLRMPYHVNIVLACLVSLRVLNTSGLRAVPVTFKSTILVGTLGLW